MNQIAVKGPVLTCRKTTTRVPLGTYTFQPRWPLLFRCSSIRPGFYSVLKVSASVKPVGMSCGLAGSSDRTSRSQPEETPSFPIAFVRFPITGDRVRLLYISCGRKSVAKSGCADSIDAKGSSRNTQCEIEDSLPARGQRCSEPGLPAIWKMRIKSKDSVSC